MILLQNSGIVNSELFVEVMGIRVLYLVLAGFGIQLEFFAMLCHICFLRSRLID